MQFGVLPPCPVPKLDGHVVTTGQNVRCVGWTSTQRRYQMAERGDFIPCVVVKAAHGSRRAITRTTVAAY